MVSVFAYDDLIRTREDLELFEAGPVRLWLDGCC